METCPMIRMLKSCAKCKHQQPIGFYQPHGAWTNQRLPSWHQYTPSDLMDGTQLRLSTIHRKVFVWSNNWQPNHTRCHIALIVKPVHELFKMLLWCNIMNVALVSSYAFFLICCVCIILVCSQKSGGAGKQNPPLKALDFSFPRNTYPVPWDTSPQ